jgi:hypothetical protein
MPRRRELVYGRTKEWQDRMADKKTVPGYAGTLDMADPDSIRAYVRDQLAVGTDPSVAQLKRLEMLSELATQLDASKAKTAGVRPALSLVEAQAASEELRRRQGGGQ